MGVMPLPHFSTLYLHPDAYRVKLEQDSPTVGQFGRLHFTASEIKRLERSEKEKRTNQMAFGVINIAELPVREFGRRATEPRVSFSEGGQFQFNVLMQKAWKGVGKLLVQFDPEKNLLAFKGYKLEDKVKTKTGEIPETSFMKVKWGKDKEGNATGLLSASGAAVLAKIGYDFSAAGNQSFEAKFDEKNKLYIVEVPKETPARKPTVERKAKATKAPATPEVKIEAPADEELLIEA